MVVRRNDDLPFQQIALQTGVVPGAMDFGPAVRGEARLAYGEHPLFRVVDDVDHQAQRRTVLRP